MKEIDLRLVYEFASILFVLLVGGKYYRLVHTISVPNWQESLCTCDWGSWGQVSGGWVFWDEVWPLAWTKWKTWYVTTYYYCYEPNWNNSCLISCLIYIPRGLDKKSWGDIRKEFLNFYLELFSSNCNNNPFEFPCACSAYYSYIIF